METTKSSTVLHRSRKGFSLVELLIAIVVLGILTMIVVSGGAAAQERARNTAVVTAFTDYRTAFSGTVLSLPGVMKDREEAWGTAEEGTPGADYTAEKSMARLVRNMNERLQPEFRLYWWPSTDFDGDGAPDDTAPKVWRTQNGSDPWGGYYVLTEYPESTDGSYPSVFDPMSEAGRSAMCICIWATGKDEGIIVDKVVSDDSRGILMQYKGGVVTHAYQGIASADSPGTSFLGSTIPMK